MSKLPDMVPPASLRYLALIQARFGISVSCPFTLLLKSTVFCKLKLPSDNRKPVGVVRLISLMSGTTSPAVKS